MKHIDYEAHPFAFVREILSAEDGDWTLSFSKYLYRPQSVFDQRELVEVSASDLDSSWIEGQISTLQPEWELALNSKIIDPRGRTHHIGMIDFVGRPDISLVSERIRLVLGPQWALRVEYFDSGRSLHGYLGGLMRPGEWHQYLGRLLLMNFPDSAPIVDARWIGHRLLGGYSALRWSANSSYHFHVPVRTR